MRRRKFVSLVAASAVSGCLGGSDGAEPGEPDLSANKLADCDASAESAEYVDSEWWRMPGHDTVNTLHVPVEGIRDEPSEAWKHEDGEDFTDAAIVDGVVYFGRGSDASAVAVDVQTGDELWTTGLDGGWVSAPAVAEDGVYFVSGPEDDEAGGGTLTRLDKDGEVVWIHSAERGTARSSPAPGYGRVYYHTHAGSGDVLYAVDASSGDEDWRAEGEALVSYPPAVTEGRVYVIGSGTGTLTTLNAEEGSVEWKTENVASPIGRNIPTLHDGAVYFDIYGVCADDGREVVRFEIEGEAAGGGVGPLAVNDDYLFVTSASGSGEDVQTVFRYGFEDGETFDYGLEYARDIAVTETVLYALDGRETTRLRGFDVETGDELWSVAADAPSLAVTRETVVVAGYDSIRCLRRTPPL
jgi:outer membrane protein assembly factor BamB